jgi:hypothetical protein
LFLSLDLSVDTVLYSPCHSFAARRCSLMPLNSLFRVHWAFVDTIVRIRFLVLRTRCQQSPRRVLHQLRMPTILAIVILRPER